MKETKNKLSPITIILHWIIALAIITLLGVGIYMKENEVFSLYGIHKSVGVSIFILILLRVIWRIAKGWPEPVRQFQPIEQLLSKTVLYILLIGTLLMPISGFVMSAAGGHGVKVFGVELVAANPDPAKEGEVIPHNGTVAGISHSLHGWVGYLMLIALLLHIAGAVKHHHIDKDNTLRRMLGRSET